MSQEAIKNYTNSEKEKILIVEDDSILLRQLNKAFLKRDFECFISDSLAQAKELIQSVPFDRVVLDLALPDGSSLTLIEHILVKNPKAKIIVLTGFGTIHSAVEATKLGAVNYLTKPCSLQEILDSFDGSSAIVTNSTPSLAQVEWEHMQRVLAEHHGNISKAADALGMHRRSLQRKLSKAPGKLA